MVKLFFCGDIIYRGEDAQNIVDNELAELIQTHDIKCCNFEAPAISKELYKKIPKVGPSHCQTEECAENIKKVGFNLISIANNHIMDYGVKGLENTINLFKPLTVIGAGLTYDDTYKTYRYKKDNISISFISVAENGFGACLEGDKYGYAWMQNKNIRNIIKKEKEECDYVIMNCHAGAELFSYPLPEIKELYKQFVDWGADIIIGHHPHVIQGYENYNKGTIFYSLGNFIFDGDKPERCRISYGVSINIKNKSEYEFEIIPCIFDNNKVSKYTQEYKKQIIEFSEVLNKEEYNKIIDQFCEDKYNNTYKNYYRNVCGISTANFKSRFKSSIKLLLNKNNFNDNFLYHNIEIETHFWICKRALKNKRSNE